MISSERRRQVLAAAAQINLHVAIGSTQQSTRRIFADAIVATGNEANVFELLRAVIAHKFSGGVVIDRQKHNVAIVNETLDIPARDVFFNRYQRKARLGEARKK